MTMISVLIPARNEPYLERTIEDVFAKSVGDIEVIAVLDGVDAPLREDPRLKIVRKPKPEGMRQAINSASAIAQGEFLMKLDAHCMVSPSFDKVLAADCDRDWIMVPRRYALDPQRWQIVASPKYPIDYHYLEYPWFNRMEPGFHGRPWVQRRIARMAIPIDDEMSSQGSCWFMHRYYFEKLGLMQTEGYGNFAQEFQELGFKCWLSGGRVAVNKRCHYAHWHKTGGRGYPLPKDELGRSAKWVLDTWWNHPRMEWFIDKFSPIPTWPANWKELGKVA